MPFNSVLIASSRSRSLEIVVAFWLFPALLAVLAWVVGAEELAHGRAFGGVVVLALIFAVVLFGAGLYELLRPSYTVEIDLSKGSVRAVRQSPWRRSEVEHPLKTFDSVVSTWDRNTQSYCVNLVGGKANTQLLVKRFPPTYRYYGPADRSAEYRKEVATFCGFRDLGLLGSEGLANESEPRWTGTTYALAVIVMIVTALMSIYAIFPMWVRDHGVALMRALLE